MNTFLLKRVRDAIAAEAKGFSMRLWYSFNPEDLDGAQEETDEEEPALPPCGYAACIAGHAVLIGAADAGVTPSREELMEFDAGAIAQSLLGLNSLEAAEIFHVEAWPEFYRDSYADAVSQTERAGIACAFLNDIISRHEEGSGP